MESPNVTQPSQSVNSVISYYRQTKVTTDSLIIRTMTTDGASSSADSVDAGINDVFKGLSVTAKNIVDKLNEMLKAKLPNGVESLKPEEVTPEATADRIVQGSTAFFDTYAKQHPELQGEDLLNKFMETIKGGIQKGYDDAFSTLEGLGAFQFDGVKEGVEKTKSLIEEKLKAFEVAKRKEMGLDTDSTAQDVAANTSSELLKQAGGSLNVVA